MLWRAKIEKTSFPKKFIFRRRAIINKKCQGYSNFALTFDSRFSFLTEDIQYHDGLQSRELGQAPILLCGSNSQAGVIISPAQTDGLTVLAFRILNYNLDSNLTNCVSPDLKLHNRYCHTCALNLILKHYLKTMHNYGNTGCEVLSMGIHNQ